MPMKAIIPLSLALLMLLMAGCAQTPGTDECTPTGENQGARTTCPSINGPFGITFTEPYVKQDYFTIKPLLPYLEAEDCEQALQERENTTKSLCRIQHAEIIREAGRQDGKDIWQWRIDCACSYEQGG